MRNQQLRYFIFIALAIMAIQALTLSDNQGRWGHSNSIGKDYQMPRPRTKPPLLQDGEVTSSKSTSPDGKDSSRIAHLDESTNTSGNLGSENAKSKGSKAITASKKDTAQIKSKTTKTVPKKKAGIKSAASEKLSPKAALHRPPPQGESPHFSRPSFAQFSPKKTQTTPHYDSTDGEPLENPDLNQDAPIETTEPIPAAKTPKPSFPGAQTLIQSYRNRQINSEAFYASLNLLLADGSPAALQELLESLKGVYSVQSFELGAKAFSVAPVSFRNKFQAYLYSYAIGKRLAYLYGALKSSEPQVVAHSLRVWLYATQATESSGGGGGYYQDTLVLQFKPLFLRLSQNENTTISQMARTALDQISSKRSPSALPEFSLSRTQ